jgi:hypothetical protein
VDQDGTLAAVEHAARVLERFEHVLDAVAADRTEIAEAERLEEQARRDERLERLLGLVRPFHQVAGHRRQELLRVALEPAHQRLRHLARQERRERSDIGRDRHLVVVQDHQQVLLLQLAGVVQRLEGHPAGHAAVADQRDRDARLAAVLFAARDTERGGNRGAGVTGAKMVVRGFVAPEELPDAALLADAVETRASAGEHLVRVALMTHVEDEAIDGRLEDGVDCRDQLHGAEARGEMAAALGDALHDLLTQLLADAADAFARECAQVGGALDPVQQPFAHRAQSPPLIDFSAP